MFEKPEGFRLNRFELLNWGTFDRQIWKIEPHNHNALLTGDIGSGKSTIVDALTILLVPRPSNQIVFNKAAGAEAQERNLRSYILGEYKNEVDSDNSRAKAVYLRDPRSYSVLLAYFYNQDLDQGLTIAQLFYFREQGGSPERIFIVAKERLSIVKDFQNFDDIQHLRRKLRKKGAKVGSTLRDYVGEFRRVMGITSDRALELFYQTLSMKSVTDLTQFVREHMLEADDAKQRVDDLCLSFDDLNRAHQAVVKAREQIEKLKPLTEAGNNWHQTDEQLTAATDQRDALTAWRAQRQLELEKQRYERLLTELKKLDGKIEQTLLEDEQLRAKIDGLRQSIADNGGRRLQEIERETQRLDKDFQRVSEARQSFQARSKSLGYSPPKDHGQFIELQTQLKQSHEQLKQEEVEYDNRLMEVNYSWQNIRRDIENDQAEINSLKGRPSNIPRHLLALRAKLCESLGLAEDQLPFAGELIQVVPGETAWEGAIERVLHNFALSLLVREQDYRAVSEWVNQTHLKGRLVYYRYGQPQKMADLGSLGPQSLVKKLALREDHLAYDWLISQLVERFDYQCCETLDQFRRSPFAITAQGQIKSGGGRHEKDDRHNIGDRSRYVMGWDNRAKLKALEEQCQQREANAQKIAAELVRLQAERDEQRKKLVDLQHLLEVGHFELIDTESIVTLIHSLKAEKKLIKESSKKLSTLTEQLSHVEAEALELRKKSRALDDKRSDVRGDLRSSENSQSELSEMLSEGLAAGKNQFFNALDQYYQELYPDDANLQNIRAREKVIREKLKAEIAALAKRKDRLLQDVIRRMQDYCQAYPAETAEIDANIDALPDYRKALHELESDDLPRYEARFKQELNEKTIQSIVHFQNRLERSRRDIITRLEQINRSLQSIDYNPGSFIELKAQGSQDQDVKEFQSELRGCLEGSLNSEIYDEQRFLKVKALIERFRGREGSLEYDRRWTQKVTDVRHWFEFAAAEIWRSDGSLREYYESSSGKSGGQKEKLAYTVLASALAYQYGLDAEKDTSHTFRFVCIDEAFGKGSDESTRYGLELFKNLGLQLLIVTPLQKISIIEDYVQAVHFVHNEGGKNSMLRNMSIEEFRRDRKHYRQIEVKRDSTEEISLTLQPET